MDEMNQLKPLIIPDDPDFEDDGADQQPDPDNALDAIPEEHDEDKESSTVVKKGAEENADDEPVIEEVKGSECV